MFVRVLAVLLISVTPVLVTVAPAAACSCRYSTAEETVEESDSLFVGRVISTRESTAEIKASGPFRTMTHIFEVESVIKGEFEGLAVVYSPWGGGACGLEGRAAVGELVGLRTQPVGDGTHDSNLCMVRNAEEILAYAGEDAYPPQQVSFEREAELLRTNEPSPSAEQEDLDGRSIPYLSVTLFVAVPVLGYALWRFGFNRQESASDR